MTRGNGSELSARPLSAHGGTVIEPLAPAALADVAVQPVLDAFARDGVVLLRGFDADLEGFRALTDRLGRDFSLYEGGVFRFRALDREQVGKDPTVMTTTGQSTGFPIAPHGEMYYMGKRPSTMWFFCQRPAAKGGQTTVHDGALVARELDDAARSELMRRDTVYERRLGDADWRTTFRTESRERALELCADAGTEASFADDGSLSLRYTCRAIVDRDGVPTCVNSVLPVWTTEHAFESGWVRENMGDLGDTSPISVRFEDGSRLPPALVEEIARAAEEAATEVDWQAGDLLMIDNTRVMHGRRRTKDAERSVVVRMGSLAG